MIISVEGNIGSGKSTLLQFLDSRHRRPASQAQGQRGLQDHAIQILQEPVGSWTAPRKLLDNESMLHRFYADRKKHAFAFQMFVLATRVQQIQHVLADIAEESPSPSGHRNTVITERCMASDERLFTAPLFKEGLLDAVEMTAYKEWSDMAKRVLLQPLFMRGGAESSEPDAVIYVRTSPETCMARIQKRGRTAECPIEAAYIRGLHDEHEAWIKGLKCPVFVVDGERHGDAAIQAHADAILQWMQDSNFV